MSAGKITPNIGGPMAVDNMIRKDTLTISTF